MNQNNKPVSQMSEDPVVKFGNGWRVAKNKATGSYVAECVRGKRPRKAFILKSDACDHARVQSALQGNRNTPLINMKDNKLTLIQDIAATLENAPEEMVLAWKAIAAASPETFQAMTQIMPSLASCSEKHKAATMVITALSKLHPTRSHWTVSMMVDSRLSKKREVIACLPDDKRRERADAHYKQAEEVGNMLIRLLGAETDIDSITKETMAKWKLDYAEYHLVVNKRALVASTMEAKMNLASQNFNHVKSEGWQGANPCRVADVPRSSAPVALTFEEFAGVTIALNYLDKQACRVWLDEVHAMARDIEARGITKADTDLIEMRLRVNPKASSNYGAEGTGTTVGDEMVMRPIDITDPHYQWIRYLDLPEMAQGWTRNRKTLHEIIRKARGIADCLRWSEKDTGRHTGRNLYRKWSIPEWKIKELMGHAHNSQVTVRNYTAVLTHPDALGMLLVTPYYLGLIAEPFPYSAPQEDVLHLGHRMKLSERHQALVDEYLPKLRAIHEKIKKKMGITG